MHWEPERHDSPLKIKSYRRWIAIGLVCLCVLLLAGCGSPKKVVYMQDAQPAQPIEMAVDQPIRLKQGDRLSITVHSRDEELSRIFNIQSAHSREPMKYTVDRNGQIDFPTLGLVSVEGLTREEVANTVKYGLISSRMVRDPVVMVEFHDMGISVLGEVNQPGWKAIEKDQMTLLEALARSGDLTINGRRDNVMVVRHIDGDQHTYRIDLTDGGSLYASPAYYLQSGDVVYVEPNMTRINQSTPNGNNLRTPAFWISIASFAMTLVVFFTSK